MGEFKGGVADHRILEQRNREDELQTNGPWPQPAQLLCKEWLIAVVGRPVGGNISLSGCGFDFLFQLLLLFHVSMERTNWKFAGWYQCWVWVFNSLYLTSVIGARWGGTWSRELSSSVAPPLVRADGNASHNQPLQPTWEVPMVALDWIIERRAAGEGASVSHGHEVIRPSVSWERSKNRERWPEQSLSEPSSVAPAFGGVSLRLWRGVA